MRRIIKNARKGHHWVVTMEKGYFLTPWSWLVIPQAKLGEHLDCQPLFEYFCKTNYNICSVKFNLSTVLLDAFLKKRYRMKFVNTWYCSITSVSSLLLALLVLLFPSLSFAAISSSLLCRSSLVMVEKSVHTLKMGLDHWLMILPARSLLERISLGCLE